MKEIACIILFVLILGMIIQNLTKNKEEGLMDKNYKELRKSAGNRKICGVCGGIGEYFGIDPTIFRLLFVLIGCTGTGIVAYIIMAIIMPD